VLVWPIAEEFLLDTGKKKALKALCKNSFDSFVKSETNSKISYLFLKLHNSATSLGILPKFLLESAFSKSPNMTK